MSFPGFSFLFFCLAPRSVSVHDCAGTLVSHSPAATAVVLVRRVGGGGSSAPPSGGHAELVRPAAAAAAAVRAVVGGSGGETMGSWEAAKGQGHSGRRGRQWATALQTVGQGPQKTMLCAGVDGST